MEKELIELFETVKKAADAAAADGRAGSSPEEDRCLDSLKRLQKFPVNYQILVSTQVGKRLRHLTKHPRKKIQDLASELIDIWKNIIINETVKNKNGILDNNNKDSVKAAPDDAQAAGAKKLQKVNSVKVEKVSKVGKGDRSVTANSIKSETLSAEKRDKYVDAVKIEKNNSEELIKVEKIIKEEKLTSDVRKPTPALGDPPKLTSLIYCKDDLRDKIRQLLLEALSKVSSEVDEDERDEADARDPIRVAVEVETALFEQWGRSNGAQKVKYRSLMFNIEDPKNPDFRRKVLLGEFQADQVPKLTAEDMASDQLREKNKKIKEKALFECEREVQPKATTDQFQCRRCWKKETTYYQMQTRSADEPMTTYVTCVNCNNRWKFC